MLFVYIETLGCKVNQYESACIINDFKKHGFENTNDITLADVIIINTCTVTNRADYKSRNLINKAKKIKLENSDVKIVVTGCYSQQNRSELLRTGYIDLIVDNNHKSQIYEQIASFLISKEHIKQQGSFSEANSFVEFTEMNTTEMFGRNRGVLKIQDGCNFSCAYCIVPSVRGIPRSRSIESIENQVKILLENGYQEIVLSGINLGLYENLPTLLYRLDNFRYLKSIRLSSIEPQLFTEHLLKAISDIDKICPHFHIPLQTGNDALLKLHNRRYTTSYIKDLINTLHSKKLYPAIGFDIIVGLPGETEEFFHDTFSLLEYLDFTYLHVFNFSKRKGTPAYYMDNQVHGTIAKKRSEKLINLSEKKKNKYINTLINQKIELLVNIEGYDEKTKLYYGTSDRYVKVYTPSNIDSSNKKIPHMSIYKNSILCN